MVLRILLAGLLLCPTLSVAQADKETLADIRQQLEVLYVNIQTLKRELSTTGSPNVSVQGSGTQQRLDSIVPSAGILQRDQQSDSAVYETHCQA